MRHFLPWCQFSFVIRAYLDFITKWMDGSVDNFSWAGENGEKFRFWQKHCAAEWEKRHSKIQLCKNFRFHWARNNWHEESFWFLTSFRGEYLQDWESGNISRSVKTTSSKAALAHILRKHGIPALYSAFRSVLRERGDRAACWRLPFHYILPIYNQIRKDWASRFGKLENMGLLATSVWKTFPQQLRKRKMLNCVFGVCIGKWNKRDANFKPAFLTMVFPACFTSCCNFRFFRIGLKSANQTLMSAPARNMAIFSQLIVVKFEYLSPYSGVPSRISKQQRKATCSTTFCAISWMTAYPNLRTRTKPPLIRRNIILWQ